MSDPSRHNRTSRLARAAAVSGVRGKLCPAEGATQLLEAIVEPGDRVAIEGDNQKQADFLAAALAKVDPARVHDLHMVQSVIALPEHLDVFERGVANRLDFAFAGPQSRKLAELVASKALRIGAIHTYLELYARMLVDLTPQVALVVADKADRDGNLYTGPNTEDTPTIVEAAAFRGGIVVAQVNEIVDRLPRVDIPGDWIDFVVPSPKPYLIDPLFTRDPAKIRNENVLMAMMAIAAVYEPYQVQRLNHGIGYATAAIELILPTFAARRGLKGKVARHFVLNPHPTLIPAIEAGFVDSVYCFGSELGMERYVSSRADVFPVGADGNLRSNRALAQVAGQYACDLFIGGTLQIDAAGQQLDGYQGPHHRLRRRAEHGRRRAWPAPRHARLAARRPGSRREPARTQARGANGADASAERRTELCRTAGRVRPRSFRGLRVAAGDDLWRRCQPRHHRTRRSQPVAMPFAAGTRSRLARYRGRHRFRQATVA